AQLALPLRFFGAAPNLTTMDTGPLWSDSKAALMVGSAPRATAVNVDEAVAGLPVANRFAMRRVEGGSGCESAMDSVDWEGLEKVFEEFFRVRIPLLATAGPEVTDIFGLMRLALKIVSVSPHRAPDAPTLPDSLLDSIAGLCRACGSFPAVSYSSLVDAHRKIRVAPRAGTLFAGLGPAVDSLVAAAASRDVDDDPASAPRHLKLVGSSSLATHLDRCAKGAIIALDVAPPPRTSKLPPGAPLRPGDAFRVNITVLASDALRDLAIPAWADNGIWDEPVEDSAFGRAIAGSAVLLDDGNTFAVRIVLERDLIGVHDLGVKIWTEDQFSNLVNGTLNATASINCGYSPELQQVGWARLPRTNPLVGIFDEVPSMKLSGIDVPIKYHILSHDLSTTTLRTPYAAETLAYLLSLSPLAALQNARRLTLNELALPAPIRSRTAITDPCPARGGARVPAERVVYRSDVFEVVPCLEAGEGFGEGVAVGVRAPSVALVTVKKSGRKLLLFNVHLSDNNPAEARLLLITMEHFRLTHGLPIVVAGNLGAEAVPVIDQALRETLLWRNFFPPSRSPTPEALWAPFLPDPTTTPPMLHPPEALAAPLAPHRLCLSIDDESPVERAACADLIDYARTFRTYIGGAIADDRVLARHEICAADISGAVPVIYEVENGDTPLSLITYDLTTLTPSRLATLQDTNTTGHLASFDLILLQGLAGPVPNPATTLLAALHDSGAINASSLTSSPTTTHNVHIYYRPSPSLTLVDCIAEPVDVNGDAMLGCAFSTRPGANHLIVVTLDYSLVRPVEELPDAAVGVMKRIYGKLCAKIKGQACADYAVPAIFAGVWGDEVMRGDGGWTEFRAAVEKVEKE
ncbi:hypothetical protein BDK51DRAFT_27077, partial [Blyttiomyces helicus]